MEVNQNILHVRLIETTLRGRINAAAARAGVKPSEWSRRVLRRAVERGEAAQRRKESATDYAVRKANGEGAPL
jgi:hypothetical protein